MQPPPPSQETNFLLDFLPQIVQVFNPTLFSCNYVQLSDVGFLLEFLRYLKTGNQVDKEIIMQAEIRLENMRRNLCKRRGVHKAKFQERDSQIHFTDDDLQNFFKSTKAAAARIALYTDTKLTVREIGNVRNYLLACIIVENCCRPAALFALSLSVFIKARGKPQQSMSQNTTYFVIVSFYDKTVAVTGLPNYLVLSEPLMDQLSRYVDKFRPQVARRNADAPDDLFLLEQGTRMDDAAISNGYR